MKDQITKLNPFRVELANELYAAMGENNSWCQEYGIDTNGNIYFHYQNGTTDRYTRTEFIKMARQKNEEWSY